MKFKSKISSILVAPLLVLALLLPASVQLAHAFEGHEHKSCDELKVHLHENEIDCSLCDFQLVSYNYVTFSNDVAQIINIPTSPGFVYHEAAYKSTSNYRAHRGPPFLV